jgi:hypothetical protein
MNFGTLWSMFGPRLIGAAASAAAGFVFAKTRGTVQLDATQLAELGTTMIGTYALAHTASAVKINPAAAAAPALIEQGKLDNTALKEGAELAPLITKPTNPQSTR